MIRSASVAARNIQQIERFVARVHGEGADARRVGLNYVGGSAQLWFFARLEEDATRVAAT
jgi:hypothetical protein